MFWSGTHAIYVHFLIRYQWGVTHWSQYINAINLQKIIFFFFMFQETVISENEEERGSFLAGPEWKGGRGFAL